MWTSLCALMIDVVELKMVIERIASRSGIQSSHSPLFRVWERDPSEIFCARKKPLPHNYKSSKDSTGGQESGSAVWRHRAGGLSRGRCGACQPSC